MGLVVLPPVLLLARVPMARREAAIGATTATIVTPWKNPDFVPRTGRHVAAYMCTRIMWVNEKSSAQYVYVRLSEWLGWPQASPREPLRCHISSLVIVETLKDSLEETQTGQTTLYLVTSKP